MNFEEFVNEMKERIKDYLPEEYADATIEIAEARKLNAEYPALIIRREGQMIAPSIDLDTLYRQLEICSMEEVLEQTAEIAQRRPEGLNLEVFTDYEAAKDQLFIRISDAEKNKAVLADVPHTEVNGLAITYHVMAEVEENEMGSSMITNQIMEKFGITKEQLHADAMANSPRILPPHIESMESMLSSMMGFGAAKAVPVSFAEQLADVVINRDGGMAVLTNSQKVNGAAVMFYPDVMEQIGDSQQVNIFILPSSTHEVILVPDNGSMKLKDLEDMVKSINASEVAPKDRLSDTVYHYDFKEKLLEKASDYENRTRGDVSDSTDAPKAKQKKEKDWER